MKSKLPVLVALVPLGLALPLEPPRTEGGEATPLVLSRTGVMYVGGRKVEMRSAGRRSGPDAASTRTVGQAAVHFLLMQDDNNHEIASMILRRIAD